MKQQFQKYTQAVLSYLSAHKRDIQIAAPIVGILIVLVGLIALSTVKNLPNIVYKPTKACDLLTPEKAQSLLGDKMKGVDQNDPVIKGNTAISKCGYNDLNPDQGQLKVLAVGVQSGINDKGVAQNKAGFKQSQKNKTIESVKDLGDEAYFDPTTGSLNVLDGKRWIIINYGYGQTPEENSVEQETALARDILKK